MNEPVNDGTGHFLIIQNAIPLYSQQTGQAADMMEDIFGNTADKGKKQT